VVLATDLYRPAGPDHSSAPRAHAYDKSASSRSERTAARSRGRSRAEVAAYFIEHGYAVAYQTTAALLVRAAF
jgi:predicted acyl esterase